MKTITYVDAENNTKDEQYDDNVTVINLSYKRLTEIKGPDIIRTANNSDSELFIDKAR